MKKIVITYFIFFGIIYNIQGQNLNTNNPSLANFTYLWSGLNVGFASLSLIDATNENKNWGAVSAISGMVQLMHGGLQYEGILNDFFKVKKGTDDYYYTMDIVAGSLTMAMGIYKLVKKYDKKDSKITFNIKPINMPGQVICGFSVVRRF